MKEKYKTSWDEFEKQVESDVKEKYNVEFIKDVDKEAFQKAVQPMYDKLKKESPEVYELVEKVQETK